MSARGAWGAGSPQAKKRPLRRNPVSLLFSRTLWASAGYVFAYLIIAWVLFGVALTIAIGGGLLSVTLIGLPVLIAAAAVIKGCANFERARLAGMGLHVGSGYREFTGSGLLTRMRHQWSDPALWRDIAYLFGLMAPLLVLDFAVTVVWLVLLAGITLPAWYQSPRQSFTLGVSGNGSSSAHGVQLGYFPHGPHGPGSWGLYVDTLPKALATAGVCLVLFLLFNYVLVAAARLHASIARALLRAPSDPLREAKHVLDGPGPLSADLRG
jgi:Putative sensor